MSRRKRKIFYWVQNVAGVADDWPRDHSFWWVPGRKWQRIDNSTRLPAGSSNIRKARTFSQALRHAEHLLQLGGTPLISQFVIKRGRRRERLYWFPEAEPHPDYLK